MKEVTVKGHAHSFNTHWYKKVDGVWKFAGLCPDIRWGEFDFDKIFESGREELGEEDKQKAAGESVVTYLRSSIRGVDGLLTIFRRFSHFCIVYSLSKT